MNGNEWVARERVLPLCADALRRNRLAISRVWTAGQSPKLVRTSWLPPACECTWHPSVAGCSSVDDE